jgi:hypothetical protein
MNDSVSVDITALTFAENPVSLDCYFYASSIKLSFQKF